MGVRFVPEVAGKAAPAVTGTLTVLCAWVGNHVGLTPHKSEGVNVDVRTFHFRHVMDQGFNIYHELR
jgi:hypothetical protein